MKKAIYGILLSISLLINNTLSINALTIDFSEMCSVFFDNEEITAICYNGEMIWNAEKIVWSDDSFSKTHDGDGGEYIHTISTTLDLTKYNTIDFSINVIFNGDYRGPNDFVSIFVDSTEYKLLEYGAPDESHNLSKKIDISELSGEHVIKVWLRSNESSNVFPASVSGTISLKLCNQ